MGIVTKNIGSTVEIEPPVKLAMFQSPLQSKSLESTSLLAKSSEPSASNSSTSSKYWVAQNWRNSDFPSYWDSDSLSRKFAGTLDTFDLPALCHQIEDFDQVWPLPGQDTPVQCRNHCGTTMNNTDNSQLVIEGYKEGIQISCHSRCCALSRRNYTAQYPPAAAKKATQVFLS